MRLGTTANPTFSEIAIAMGRHCLMFDMKAQKPNRKTAAGGHIRFVEIPEYNH